MNPYSVVWDVQQDRWKVTDEKGNEPLKLPLRADHDTASVIASALNKAENETNLDKLLKRIYNNMGS